MRVHFVFFSGFNLFFITHVEVCKLLRLTLPSTPKILICCDGNSKGNPGASGYGFVARNFAGKMLIAVAGGIGIATTLIAEILAVVSAGEWAVQNNNLEVCFRSGSKAAVLAFKSNKLPWFIISRWNKVCDCLVGYAIEQRHTRK